MKKIVVCIIVIVIVLLALYTCTRMKNEGTETAAAADEISKTDQPAEEAEAVEEPVKEAPAEKVQEEPEPKQEAEPEQVKPVEPRLKPAARNAGKREKAPVQPKEPEKTIEKKAEPAPKSEKLAVGPKEGGNIDSAGVMKVIRASNAAIKRCYDKALITNPSLQGKISVKIVVNMEGRVGSVTLSEDTLKDAEVAKCVQGVIGRLRFPKPEGGPATIVYPYSFTR